MSDIVVLGYSGLGVAHVDVVDFLVLHLVPNVFQVQLKIEADGFQELAAKEYFIHLLIDEKELNPTNTYRDERARQSGSDRQFHDLETVKVADSSVLKAALSSRGLYSLSYGKISSVSVTALKVAASSVLKSAL